VILEEIAESIGGSVVLADCGERLSDEELDLGSFALESAKACWGCPSAPDLTVADDNRPWRGSIASPTRWAQLDGFLEGRDWAASYLPWLVKAMPSAAKARDIRIELRAFSTQFAPGANCARSGPTPLAGTARRDGGASFRASPTCFFASGSLLSLIAGGLCRRLPWPWERAGAYQEPEVSLPDRSRCR